MTEVIIRVSDGRPACRDHEPNEGDEGGGFQHQKAPEGSRGDQKAPCPRRSANDVRQTARAGKVGSRRAGW